MSEDRLRRLIIKHCLIPVLGRRIARLRRDEQRLRRWQLVLNAINRPCTDCGVLHMGRMEFDHRDASQRKTSPWRMLGKNDSKIVRELRKCDVVCCGCHAMREIRRGKLHWCRNYPKAQALADQAQILLAVFGS